MTLWVPRGSIIVPDSPPEADSRMVNFLGLNGGGHTGYHELVSRAGSWPTTETTPDGPASLLRTSRESFCFGYYAYSLLAVAGTWSILAVEAALRLKLGADQRDNFKNLVRQAERTGLLPSPGWDNGRLDAGRELRNRTVHGETQQLWTPAMAETALRASHEAVAALFPDPVSTLDTPASSLRGVTRSGADLVLRTYVAARAALSPGKNSAMGFNDELRALLGEVANRVDRWTAQAVWTFEPDSAASAEVANTEARLDGTRWGDRPVRTTYAYAQMSTKLAAEFSRCAALLIGAACPAPGIETETRSALEAGSVAWWLLEPGLTARQRVCRMQLLRRNSARELARSIAEVGEDPALAGNETIAAVEAECHALGLASFSQGGDKLEGQERLKYTKRVQSLTDELGNVGAYSIYSGTAHAELAGIWRLFTQTGATLPDRQPLYSPAANPEASYAAADSSIKAMMGPVERIAWLFGWTVPGRGDEISATIDYINGEMKRLHP